MHYPPKGRFIVLLDKEDDQEGVRELYPEEKMLMMNYPTDKCDVSCNTAAELNSIAGNGMQGRAIGASYLIALALVDRQKLMACLG